MTGEPESIIERLFAIELRLDRMEYASKAECPDDLAGQYRSIFEERVQGDVRWLLLLVDAMWSALSPEDQSRFTEDNAALYEGET